MAKKNNIIQKIVDWKVILGIQVLASIVLIALFFKLNALPMLYIGAVIVLVAILCLITFLLMKPSKKKGAGKARNIAGKIISIILSAALLFGSLSVAKGDSVIGKITGANSETTRISVIVMKDSIFKNIEDLKGQTIEASDTSSENMQKAIADLKSKVDNIEIQNVDNFVQLADDLYDGKTNAIYIDEGYSSMFEDSHENFSNETRVLYTYEITKEVQDFSKDVNVTNEVFNVFISGIDTTGPVSTVSRSDVNMIVTVNPKTKQILMTSIPRDYYVTLANKGKKDKLTHAGLGGVENSVKTLENFLGIDINYYARVNFTSLIKMVDALGGIDVESPVAFTTMHGGYHIKKGTNHLNGDEALGFVRERYGLANGDNDRVKNQQRVLTAMLEKMMSPAVITNYSKVLDSIAGSFETNMSSSEITSLLKMQLNDMAKWDIMQIQLSGTGKQMTGGAYMPNNRLYYMIPDQDSVNECVSLIKKMDAGEKISISE